MLSVHDLEIRVGARLLMEDVSFRVDKGDKIGLVGRNGAGKTTLTKALAGETPPDRRHDRPPGEIGYLPQDPRSGNPKTSLARASSTPAASASCSRHAARRRSPWGATTRPSPRRP